MRKQIKELNVAELTDIIFEGTKGLDRKDKITYLKNFKAPQLIAVAKHLGAECPDYVSKTIALQKVLSKIEN